MQVEYISQGLYSHSDPMSDQFKVEETKRSPDGFKGVARPKSYRQPGPLIQWEDEDSGAGAAVHGFEGVAMRKSQQQPGPLIQWEDENSDAAAGAGADSTEEDPLLYNYSCVDGCQTSDIERKKAACVIQRFVRFQMKVERFFANWAEMEREK